MLRNTITILMVTKNIEYALRAANPRVADRPAGGWLPEGRFIMTSRRPANYYPFSVSLIMEFTDSTNVMTGYKTGAIALTERLLRKPVHWFICFSHLNKLPWRRYLNHVVSPTKSPTGWTSDWFNLDNVESLPSFLPFLFLPGPATFH
jgi:hypothetical protein